MDLEYLRSSPEAVYGVAAFVIFCLILLRWYYSDTPNLDHIPSVGSSNPILSYYGAIRYLFNAKDMTQEGYDKYKGGIFRVPLIDRWMVIATSPALIDDVRKAPDNVLNFLDSINETMQSDYVFGPEIIRSPYHIEAIRGQLTRNLEALFPDVRDEVVAAFNDTISTKEREWVKIPVVEASMKVVARVSGRVFVGLPLCRDPAYCASTVDFTIDVMKGAMTINLFPKFMKPVVGKLFTNIDGVVANAMAFIKPLYDYQLQMRAQAKEDGGEWTEKPNNMVSWLIDTAPPSSGLRDLALRIYATNFAAIHTSSINFTNALYHLAANPAYQLILRQEVEDIVEKHGWSKSSMSKMVKLDSYLKECQRFYSLGTIAMDRMARQSYTFSDGTHIPKGTLVACAAHSMHQDDTIFSGAAEFDPWRWEKMRERVQEGGDAAGAGGKFAYVSTSVDYINFGHGRHACPGRFFAANELKAMLAHVLVTYDCKFEDEGKVPKSVWFAASQVPNQKAEVLFRARK